MPDLVPVDHDPFNSAPPPVDPTTTQLVPVDHNPFADLATTDLDSLQRGQQAYDNRLTPQGVQDYLTSPAFDYMKRDYPAGPLEQASDAVVNTAANVMPGAGKAAEIAGAALSPAAIAALKDMVKGGSSLGQIADELGATRGQIAGYMNRLGLKSTSGSVGGRPAVPSKFTDDVVNQILDLNSQGMKQTDIANKLGLGQAGISRTLKDAPPRPPRDTSLPIKTGGLPDLSPEELAQYEKIFVPVDHDPFKAQ